MTFFDKVLLSSVVTSFGDAFLLWIWTLFSDVTISWVAISFEYVIKKSGGNIVCRAISVLNSFTIR